MIIKNAQALIDMSDEEFLIFVGRDTSEMSKIVYNRAIEVVAKYMEKLSAHTNDPLYGADCDEHAEQIRKLKK